MRLQSLELELDWPVEMPLNSLRVFILSKLSQYGDPLRWSIASISFDEELDCSRKLRIEAVLIID
ncbi:hypothetical protein [Prochlorococcus marinus]|uniref:hypothetical protein n=1 Tax=Prochlorococcus marinus TaxID=1219 RepID=UPI0022B4569D|nr:hypothetical protein [Prochlorococcus marinus]